MDLIAISKMNEVDRSWWQQFRLEWRTVEWDDRLIIMFVGLMVLGCAVYFLWAILAWAGLVPPIAEGPPDYG